MNDEIKKKTVSYSQFSNWFTCPYKFYRDIILHEREFEDNLNMTFGTSIHEAIQLYLTVLYEQGDQAADVVDMMAKFTETFKNEINKKKIPHTKPEFDEFVEDAKNILSEFVEPSNRLRYFPRDKWELLGIEDDIREDIVNNVSINAKLDIVMREKLSGNIRIIDIKTSGRGWSSYDKESFTKISQLLLYKALYSKKHNIPLSKIYVEFFILTRKLYESEKVRYEQSRIQVFKPTSSQSDVIQVIQEFRKFVNTCFTKEGIHKINGKYPKIPGKAKKNCKYCQYAKNKKCDRKPDIIE